MELFPQTFNWSTPQKSSSKTPTRVSLFSINSLECITTHVSSARLFFHPAHLEEAGIIKLWSYKVGYLISSPNKRTYCIYVKQLVTSPFNHCISKYSGVIYYLLRLIAPLCLPHPLETYNILCTINAFLKETYKLKWPLS